MADVIVRRRGKDDDLEAQLSLTQVSCVSFSGKNNLDTEHRRTVRTTTNTTAVTSRYWLAKDVNSPSVCCGTAKVHERGQGEEMAQG